MSHAKMFSNRVLLDLKAQSKEAAVEELCDLLISSEAVAAKYRDDIVRAVMDRERLGSTGIGGRVAMPHVKLDVVEDSIGVVGIARDGLDYSAVDGEKVNVIFMVVSPPSKSDQHLDIIRWIARVARHRDCLGFMFSANTEVDALGSLEELGA